MAGAGVAFLVDRHKQGAPIDEATINAFKASFGEIFERVKANGLPEKRKHDISMDHEFTVLRDGSCSMERGGATAFRRGQLVSLLSHGHGNLKRLHDSGFIDLAKPEPKKKL